MDAQNAGVTARNEHVSSSTHDRRANALRHGLAGTTYLPSALRCGRVDELFRRLKQETKPTTLLEELALREIARHAAILAVIEQGEPAVLRQAAQGMAGLVAVDGDAGDDVALAMAVTAEPLERVSRYRRGHEKALYSALDRIVARHQPVDVLTPPMPAAPQDRRFTTTEECESYLRQRFTSATWSCPGCGCRTGSYRERRKAWTCASCTQSVGLRAGTIFARSPVVLPIWFRAIDVVAADLQIGARELAERLGIKRVATARKMLHKIQDVLTSNGTVPPGTTRLDTIVNFGHLNAFLRNKNSASPVSHRRANQLPAHS